MLVLNGKFLERLQVLLPGTHQTDLTRQTAVDKHLGITHGAWRAWRTSRETVHQLLGTFKILGILKNGVKLCTTSCCMRLGSLKSIPTLRTSGALHVVAILLQHC